MEIIKKKFFGLLARQGTSVRITNKNQEAQFVKVCKQYAMPTTRKGDDAYIKKDEGLPSPIYPVFYSFIQSKGFEGNPNIISTYTVNEKMAARNGVIINLKDFMYNLDLKEKNYEKN